MTDRTFDITSSAVTDEVADTDTTDPSTPAALSALVSALSGEVPVPTVLIAVELRPGWAVRYRTNVSMREIDDWRKKARAGKRLDQAFLSRLILANCCLGFEKDGEPAVDDNNEPLTFATIARLESCTVADAVRVWLITDGAIEGASNLVYQRSGYSMPDPLDEGEQSDADPT